MLDVQRKRLQHLMANAILELWKKETGSLSSVIIEGTICITSGNGHTLVVQVEDRFAGVYPESYQRERGSPPYLGLSQNNERKSEQTGSMDLSSSGHGSSETQKSRSETQKSRSETQKSRSDSADGVFLPNTPTAPHDQPASREAFRPPASDSDSDIEVELDDSSSVRQLTNSYPAVVTSATVTPDGDLSSSGYSSSLGRSFYSSLGSLSEQSPVVKPNVTPLRRRSASPAFMMSSLDSPSLVSSTPKDDSKRARFEGLERAHSEEHKRVVKSEDAEEHWSRGGTPAIQRSRSGSILDLSHQRSSDLALSPPQNYTAQVRHVIRQRLLAANRPSSQEDLPSATTDQKTTEHDFKPTPSTVDSSDRPRSNQDSSATTPPSVITALPGSLADKPSTDAWSDGRIPLVLPLSGPASWPVAGQSSTMDKLTIPLPPPPPPAITEGSKFFLPGHFSPLLSIGPHSPLPPLPASPAAAAMFSLTARGLPLPPGITYQDLANLSKPPVSSALSSPGSGLLPGGSSSERSSPTTDVCGTDINGNSTDKPELNNGSVTTNGDQKVYVCEYCNKHFLFKSKYHEHLPVHTNVRPYQCHLCSRTYKYKYDLQVHLRTHMGIPTKSTVCPFCSGKFDTNKMLRNHIVEAHQDRQKVTKEECTQPADNLPPAL